MKYRPLLLILFAALALNPFTAPQASAEDAAKSTLKVAVATGGHAFDEEAFLALFKSLKGVAFVHEAQKDHSELFEDIQGWDYDVIVLYNMTQEISEKRRKNFLSLLEKGVGVVALHHALAAFQGWDEFHAIIGANYILKPKGKQRNRHPGSTFLHDADYTIQIANPSHPVAKGIKDFKVHDETYKQCVFSADNEALLTTDHPASDIPIGWTRTYLNARICSITPGHGPAIFADKTYRKLIANAIHWTSQR